MISAFVILFRETLEAALIVTILLAASRGVPLRGRYIGGGIIGGLFGAAIVAGASLFGWLLYAGLLRIPLKQIFKATGVIVTFLAAGLAAQGAAYLVQAGVLPALGTRLWDTSWLLSEDGIIGRLCHILFGYV